jgi:hypothetical protein
VSESHQLRRTADPSRYGKNAAGGSNQPPPVRRGGPALRLFALPRRADLTELLGRSVLEDRVQLICRQWGLRPYAGNVLSRSYVAHDVGAELAADAGGVVTAIFLHFHGDDGFAGYCGVIPGVGGPIAGRAELWAALGLPLQALDEFLGAFGPSDTWSLPRFVLNAQYAFDADHLSRITLTSLPER